MSCHEERVATGGKLARVAARVGRSALSVVLVAGLCPSLAWAKPASSSTDPDFTAGIVESFGQDFLGGGSESLTEQDLTPQESLDLSQASVFANDVLLNPSWMAGSDPLFFTTGSSIPEPTVRVEIDGVAISPDKYDISWYSVSDPETKLSSFPNSPGTCTLKVVPKDGESSEERSYQAGVTTAYDNDLSFATITLDSCDHYVAKDNYTKEMLFDYKNGTAIAVSVSVTLAGKTVPNTAYNLKFAKTNEEDSSLTLVNNVADKGTYSPVIEAISGSQYQGATYSQTEGMLSMTGASDEFKVVDYPDLQYAQVSGEPVCMWTGYPVTPNFQLSLAGDTLMQGKDYEITGYSAQHPSDGAQFSLPAPTECGSYYAEVKGVAGSSYANAGWGTLVSVLQRVGTS